MIDHAITAQVSLAAWGINKNAGCSLAVHCAEIRPNDSQNSANVAQEGVVFARVAPEQSCV